MLEPFYEDRGVTIYCGDNRDILPKLKAAGVRVDHVLTDPPYSERTKKGARSRQGVSAAAPGSRAAVPWAASDEAIEGTLRDALELGARWAVLTADYVTVLRWESDPPKGFRQLRLGVWDKLGTGAPQYSGDRPATGFEMVSHLGAEGIAPRWNGGGQDAMYRYRLPRGGDKKTEHPTEKPVELFEIWLARFTEPGEVILDPWAGSGVLARASRGTKRTALLIEQDERWCEQAARSLAQIQLFGT